MAAGKALRLGTSKSSRTPLHLANRYQSFLPQHLHTFRAVGTSWQGKGKVDKRSIAIGVEQGLASMSGDQTAAINWLLRDIQSRHSLASTQIIQAADLGIGESMPNWDMLAQSSATQRVQGASSANDKMTR